MVRVCPHCGCADIDEDAGRGDATCMGCGTVIEESIVVSENQFQERTGGTGHTLVGQTISMDRAHATPQGVPGLSTQESREVTYQKGRKYIEEIASQLRINKHCVDTAFNFFKMCVCRNLTRGRLRSHIVASCLYMTCRLENTSHLLLDFSDVTQVNVFDLGRTLSFLSRSLRINLPTTDPCLYVLRFAVLLDFGDKQKEVVTLATRLVQRMKRDWLATGRRPTGLCGAALLLAARSHNFNRSVADVVRVVHVSEAVVRKRLDEFSQTPSSALTLDQFTTVDLEHSEDPPAYREARRKAAMQREEEEADRIELNQIVPVTEEVERALERKQREKFKKSPYAKMLTGGLDENEVLHNDILKEDEEVGEAESLVRDEIIETVFREVDRPAEPSWPRDRVHMGPSLESLGILPRGVPHPVIAPTPADDGDGELDLAGIDDFEIDSYILTDREAEVKEQVWMKCNGEHLAKVAEIRRQQAEEDARDIAEGKKKKKRRTGKKKEQIQAATPAEAIEKIIHEKKLSNKINYEILKELSGVEMKHNPKEEGKKELAGIGKEDDNTASTSTHIVPTVSAATPTNNSSFPPSKKKRTMMRPIVPPSAALKQLSKVLSIPQPEGESPSTAHNSPPASQVEQKMQKMDESLVRKPSSGISLTKRQSNGTLLTRGRTATMKPISIHKSAQEMEKRVDTGNKEELDSAIPSTSTGITRSSPKRKAAISPRKGESWQKGDCVDPTVTTDNITAPGSKATMMRRIAVSKAPVLDSQPEATNVVKDAKAAEQKTSQEAVTVEPKEKKPSKGLLGRRARVKPNIPQNVIPRPQANNKS